MSLTRHCLTGFVSILAVRVNDDMREIIQCASAPVLKRSPEQSLGVSIRSAIIDLMKVRIKLFAILRNYGPEEQEAELPEGATLEDAIRLLKLPEKMPMLKVVNGEHRNLKYALKEGDVLALFPPIGGG